MFKPPSLWYFLGNPSWLIRNDSHLTAPYCFDFLSHSEEMNFIKFASVPPDFCLSWIPHVCFLLEVVLFPLSETLKKNYFERGSHCVAKVGLELAILLSSVMGARLQSGVSHLSHLNVFSQRLPWCSRNYYNSELKIKQSLYFSPHLPIQSTVQGLIHTVNINWWILMP
jgi:hypothetical protein